MKSSKYVIIDQNILLEYIYDDQLLISEGYNVLINSNFGTKTFVSNIGSKTNNDLRNTIYKIDSTFDRYGSIILDPLVNEKIDDSISSIQAKNFPPTIPIRYDELRIHLPVNWTFGDYKGCYVRVYTYNFDESSQIDLSNYYFDISDVELINKMEYSSNLLLYGQRQWGKYLKVQFPSVTKVSDQRRDNVTIPNSINSNISNGLGISKKTPVFVDFHFIQSVDVLNGRKFFSLASRVTTLFPQTPDFENIGVSIEESTQGDFYVIYGTYNGSLGEFNTFINESYYTGNRYYLEYVVDLFEKNELIKSQTFLVNEEFNQVIEYRPIIKFSTTTAMIQVTMKIIDNANGDTITRRSSVGIIQEDVSKYSRYLSKINIRRANRVDVVNVKSVIQSKTGDDPFGTRPILILDKLPYTVYSSNFYVFVDKDNVEFSGKIWSGLDKTLVNVFPYDNILKFHILESDGLGTYRPYNLAFTQDLKFTIKSDKKTLDFPIYQDSDQNQPQFGEIVFNISRSKYNELRSLNLEGINLFYINGIDSSGNKKIVYSGVFLPVDSPLNIRRLENDWTSSQRQPDPPRPKEISEEQRLQNKISKLENEEVKPSSVIKKKKLLFDRNFSNSNKISTKISDLIKSFSTSQSSVDPLSQRLISPQPPAQPPQSDNTLPLPQVEIPPPQPPMPKVKIWVLKRKSLATLRNPNYSWASGSPVTVYDVYVRKDNSGSKIKPNSSNIDTFKYIRANSENEAKQIAFSTISGLNSGNWKKSSYPHFENIIYSVITQKGTTFGSQLPSFKVRIAGGGVGEFTTIDDHGRVYYLEEINLDI